MRQSTLSTHIDHPAGAVSVFLANLLNDKAWRKEVVETRLVSGSAGSVGATYRETLTWEGLRAPASLSVSRFDEGSRLIVIAEDPGYRASYDYEFGSSGEGTDVKLTITVETRGAIQLVEPFLSAIVTRWLERGLSSLDEVLRPQ